MDNTGDTAFSFTSALHTYFAVSDIAEASVHGLAGLHYRDSATGADNCTETGEVLRIEGEVDRIYADAPALQLREPGRTMQIAAAGFRDAVVWNPGAAKGAALADLEPEGYRRMLCVESAAIMHPVQLAPGGSWAASQHLRAEPEN